MSVSDTSLTGKRVFTLYNSRSWLVVSEHSTPSGEWVKLSTPLDGRGGGSLTGLTTIRREHITSVAV